MARRRAWGGRGRRRRGPPSRCRETFSAGGGHGARPYPSLGPSPARVVPPLPPLLSLDVELDEHTSWWLARERSATATEEAERTPPASRSPTPSSSSTPATPLPRASGTNHRRSRSRLLACVRAHPDAADLTRPGSLSPHPCSRQSMAATAAEEAERMMGRSGRRRGSRGRGGRSATGWWSTGRCQPARQNA